MVGNNLLLLRSYRLWYYIILFTFFYTTLFAQDEKYSQQTVNTVPSLVSQISGEVVNATTGKPVIATKISLLDPSQQMQSIASLVEAGPSFEFRNLNFQLNRPLLLQAEFDGGKYNQIFIAETGKSQQRVRITVYSSGAPREQINISALLWLTKYKEKLKIESMYLIDNQSKPTRAYDLKQLYFFVPNNRKNLQVFLKNGSTPIPLQIQCLPENPQRCQIDRKLIPGLNELRIQFEIDGHRYSEQNFTDLQAEHPFKLVFYNPQTNKPNIRAVHSQSAIEEVDLKLLGRALRVPYPTTQNAIGNESISIEYDMTVGDYIIENILNEHKNPVFENGLKTVIAIFITLLLIFFLGSFCAQKYKK